jgi:hypothetical protein
MKNWIRDLNKIKFGTGLHSQSYQDDLLTTIFANIGTTNEEPYCIEFGFNSSELTKGTGANVAKLVLHDKWKCLLLDGKNENPAIHLHKHFLTSTNICEIFRSYHVPKEPEYISIDVDSTDLWLFRALLKEYRALVFSIEYNPHYPLNKAITFPNETNERWERDRGYGASLKALTMVASESGYSLLWVVPPFDAFFVRNDLLDDGTSETVFPYKKWGYCTNWQFHKPLKEKNRARIFLDYEVYSSTGGDVEASRLAAYQTCMTYLAGNGDFWTQASKLIRLSARVWRKIQRFMAGGR